MIQQGQVFKLTAKGADGEPLWAYRYRLEGRGSARPQVGGLATSALGEKRIADLSPKDVYAWRLTVPKGHRFEATQALQQVLNRAVAWGPLDFNPAKRGVPNPQRRRRRSGHSSPGRRSRRSPLGSDRCTARW
ncbi:MAG: hypothetical protein WBB74_12140 [Gaiellaceae bacterium]